MSKKETPLPRRPKPPSYEQILEDLKKAPNDDIAFTYFKSRENESMSSSMLNETAFSCDETTSPQTSLEKPKIDTTGSSATQDAELAYKQVEQFMEITKELKSAPEKMQIYHEELNDLHDKLTESIASLKRQTGETTGETTDSSLSVQSSDKQSKSRDKASLEKSLQAKHRH